EHGQPPRLERAERAVDASRIAQWRAQWTRPSRRVQVLAEVDVRLDGVGLDFAGGDVLEQRSPHTVGRVAVVVDELDPLGANCYWATEWLASWRGDRLPVLPDSVVKH